MCWAVVALVGCAGTAIQMSEETNLEPDEASSSTAISQPAVLDQRAFRKLDVETNTTVTLGELQYFSTNVVSKENLTLDENEDGQINVTEFSTKATNHSELHPFFGSEDAIVNNHFSWDQQEFEPQGLRLFSIRF
jgi:hypothetical protein